MSVSRHPTREVAVNRWRGADSDAHPGVRQVLGPVRAGSNQRPPDEGDGGGARDLSHDGTRPIGGKRKHA